MINNKVEIVTDNRDVDNDTLFSLIAIDIESQGYSIQEGGLPESLTNELYQYIRLMSHEKFDNAGIGRDDNFANNKSVRTDEICWINGNSVAGQQWLSWTLQLKIFLNQHLFLGLFSFESHFAHYNPGDYYKRHYDAFKGETNRILTIVAYFNHNWTSLDGGELVIYKGEHDKNGIKVLPRLGSFVVFLSEEFPHEVLPTNRDRYSIAGWFRVNSSMANKIDPPT